MKLRASVLPLTGFVSLAALLLPMGSACFAAESLHSDGVIRGTVHITRKLTEQRMRFRLYPGFKPAPPPPDPNARQDEWRNIVIYLKSVHSVEPVSNAEDAILTMAQEGETFIPHVLPILIGSTVEFPNHDPIFHNVFSLSGTKSFDLGRYPQSDSRVVTFDRAGIIPVFCHIHSDMSAIIMVLDNQYFTVPDTDGHYRIDSIPAGTYTLVAWHERSEPIEIQVHVTGDQPLEVNITVPIEDDESTRPKPGSRDE